MKKKIFLIRMQMIEAVMKKKVFQIERDRLEKKQEVVNVSE